MDAEGYIVRNVIDSPPEGMIRETTKDIVKNNKRSEMIRKEGNSIFNNQLHDSSSHEKIWKLYSKSIALAEAKSDALALAYGNRSAILLHMSKYNDSLIDIDRALGITQSNCLRVKLLIRKAKCLHATGSQITEATLAIVESFLKNIEVEDLKKKFVDDITETRLMIKKPFQRPETPYNIKSSAIKKLNQWHRVDDFSNVEIKYNKKHGRFLVAAKDTNPGRILYHEKPYIHCVNAENIHLYCYHCLATTWTSFPCTNCTWAMFCSEQCKDEAWGQYHSSECFLYSSTTKNLDDSCTQLAIKALCRALKEYGGIKNLRAELIEYEKDKSKYRGFLKDDKIHINGFMTMYLLSKKVSTSAMERHKQSVALFFDTLSKHPEFIGEELCAKDLTNYMIRQNIFFLCTLFLRLSTISEDNKLDMWNESYTCPNGSALKSLCRNSDCCSKGVYIAPMTSLIDHSCNPNVSICYSFDSTAVIYALRPLRRGKPISRCYQEEFYFTEKFMREQLLNNIYGFKCDCEACKKDWPTLLFEQHVSSDITLSCLPAEVQLQSANERIITSALAGTLNHNIKVIESLGRDISEALIDSTKPTLTTANLIKTMSIILAHLYGTGLSVPSNCNSEIKSI